MDKRCSRCRLHLLPTGAGAAIHEEAEPERESDTHALPLIHDRAAVLAVTQAACTLMSGQPDLSPHEAVGDVLQVQKYVEDLLLSPRR